MYIFNAQIQRINHRILKDKILACFAYISMGTIVLILLTILLLILKNGFSSISLQFILEPMQKAGKGGGVLYQIIGTLILLGTTLIITMPISLGVALLQKEYITNKIIKKIIKLLLYSLNGIPSIIFGLFGFFFFVKYLEWGKSWFIGSILLSIMILPTTTIGLLEGMYRVTNNYIDNGKALGLTQTQIIYSILLPQSLGSFLSSTLIGLIRAIGETAPIMFTATIFSGISIPSGIKNNPILTLPYHIFILTQESYNETIRNNAWGSVIILIGIVCVLSLLLIPFRMRSVEGKNLE